MEKKARQSNIELLRLLAVIGVVMLHYNNPEIGGALKYVNAGTFNQVLLEILQSVFICSVNVFVIITGYFLCGRKTVNLWKAIELLIQVSLFNFLPYILRVVTGRSMFSMAVMVEYMLPINYFAIFYFVITAFSPFINISINSLKEKNFDKLMLLLLIVFCAVPNVNLILERILGRELSGLSTIGGTNISTGYTVIQFFFMYFVGAYIRKREEKINSTGSIWYLTGFILCAAGVFFLRKYDIQIAQSYNNPLVIAEAVMVFILFRKMNIGSVKIINEFSRLSFTVFLTHLYVILKSRIELFVNRSPVILVLHIIACMLRCLIAAYIVQFVYEKVTKPVYGYLEKKIDLNISRE